MTITNYEELNILYNNYSDKGFSIIPFPSNQFNQEPGQDFEIPECLQYVRPGGGYQPLFGLMSKVFVNGAERAPIYAYMTSVCPPTTPYMEGGQVYINWAPVLTTDITWNFEKFLVDQKGYPVRRYSPGTNPLELEADILALLGSSSSSWLASDN